MPLIAPPDLETIAPHVRVSYDSGRLRHAHFDELRRILVRFPAALRSADGMYDLIMEPGALTRGMKEQVFVTCSGVRGCEYAVAAHGRWLARHSKLSRGDVARLTTGESLEVHSEGDRALLAFARKVADAPYRTVSSDIEALRAVGFDEVAIVELLTVVSLSGWMNGYAAALGLEASDLDDERTGAAWR